jgi:hypothetical protein
VLNDRPPGAATAARASSVCAITTGQPYRCTAAVLVPTAAERPVEEEPAAAAEPVEDDKAIAFKLYELLRAADMQVRGRSRCAASNSSSGSTGSGAPEANYTCPAAV